MSASAPTVDDPDLTPAMTDAHARAARELGSHDVRPPTEVPGHEQFAFLGAGAYGEVWTAVNRNSGRRVAIKFFSRGGGFDWPALAREVEKLRYMFSDRYIVQLFDVGWSAEPPYFVMEYLEHGSLEDALRAEAPSVHDAVATFREVAVGLVHAHDRGVLHCDLKPANVLLDHEKRPKLADFGQSRLATDTAPALGTLFYMAPEQADLAAAPDARWDVYALGALVYRMLVGEPPHRGSPAATTIATGTLEGQLAAYRKLISSAPRPTAHRAVPGVDRGLAAIIDRCLEPNPGKRFPNPHAVLAALDAWNLRRVRRPLLWVVGGTFALLFALMILAGQYLFRTTVSTAERGVVGRALEANAFAAQTEARQLAAQVQLRWVQLEAAARDPQIRAVLAKEKALDTDRAAGLKLDQLLAERKARGDRQFAAGDKSALWYAHDSAGYQRASAPTSEPGRNVYRGYRDYFHGLGERPKGAAAPGVIRHPHRSVAYRRERPGEERIWSVAFSVPVKRDDPSAEPLGIVGMTITLADAPGERADRFAVLVDTRPDAKNDRRGLILRHPYWAKMHDENDPPLYYADAVVAWADAARGAESGDAPFADGAYYTDPVSVPSENAPAQPGYDGPWLASAHRVLAGPSKTDTGWVVVVQERRDEALRPVREMEWRLGYVGIGASVAVLGLVALMWTGVVLVLDTSSRSPVTRLLRHWAGLPTSGTSGTGTATPKPGDGASNRAGS